MKNFRMLFLILNVSIGFFSCSKSSLQEKRNMIGVITEGPINDKSFNQSTWEGMQKAQNEYGYKLSHLSIKQATEYSSAFDSLIENHPAAIIANTHFATEESYKKSKENPKEIFIQIDSTSAEIPPKNMIGVEFASEEGAFLAGFLAANLTKTGKVGFLGGIPSKTVSRYINGFEAGILYSHKNVELIKQYANSFSDVAKGRSIAELMIQNGADVFFHASGATGNGMIEAVREKQAKVLRSSDHQKFWVIGVDRDQKDQAPEIIVTSVAKRLNVAIFEILTRIKKGNFQGGLIEVLGLKGNFVDLTDISSEVSSQIKSEIQKIKQDIISGKIEVPKNEDELEAFKIKISKA